MLKLIGFIKPYLLQPLILKKNNFLPDVSIKYFFLSFSDAMNFIFKSYKIYGRSDYILLPEFYCPETIKFYEKYLKLIFYKINHDFSVDFNSYFDQLKQYHPKVIINYSFIGFPLSQEYLDNLAKISDDYIIINDCAHRILHHQEVDYFSKNNFYIDSIRKYSPLLGSHLVGRGQISLGAITAKINFYKIKCHLLELIQGIFDFFSFTFKSKTLYFWSSKIFEKLDNFIGQNEKPTSGSKISFWLWGFLDLAKIKEHRRRLALAYVKNLGGANSPLIRVLDEEIFKQGEVNYFPLFVSQKIQEELIIFLGKKKIFAEKLWHSEDANYPGVNGELYDSFIILPLSWLIKERDVARICREIKNFLNLN